MVMISLLRYVTLLMTNAASLVLLHQRYHPSRGDIPINFTTLSNLAGIQPYCFREKFGREKFKRFSVFTNIILPTRDGVNL